MEEALLTSLYINDNTFKFLCEGSLAPLPKKEKEHILKLGIVEKRMSLRGETLFVGADFTEFLSYKESLKYRNICSSALLASNDMRCYFDDIQDES